MLDLALQIHAPAEPIRNHAALVEKCPAWRLLLIGAGVKSHEVPLLDPGVTFDGPEIADWQRRACTTIGCASRELCSRPSQAWLIEDVTEANLFDYLMYAAAGLRNRHRLLFLTGRTTQEPGEWLDFTAWETLDRQQIFSSDDHRQARCGFIATQEHRHYSVPAFVFGHHWDRSWQRRCVEIPQEHTSYIGQQLRDSLACGTPLAPARAISTPSFRDEDIRVREEFNYVLAARMPLTGCAP